MALDDIVRRSGDALFQEIQGEVVALDMERGVCFGLNSVASRIWALIETPTVVRDLCTRLRDEYDVPDGECEAQVLALLEELRAEGMVGLA